MCSIHLQSNKAAVATKLRVGISSFENVMKEISFRFTHMTVDILLNYERWLADGSERPRLVIQRLSKKKKKKGELR